MSTSLGNISGKVEARLQQIEHEQEQQSYDIVLKTVGVQLVASIREQVTTYQDVGTLTAEIYAYVRALHMDSIDAAIWHDLDLARSRSA